MNSVVGKNMQIRPLKLIDLLFERHSWLVFVAIKLGFNL